MYGPNPETCNSFPTKNVDFFLGLFQTFRIIEYTALVPYRS